MRQISSDGGRHHHHLLLLLVLISVHTPAVASRLLRPVPNPAGDLKIIGGLQEEVLPEEDSWKLTGMEECKEEECERRRMMHEAHLDYIYTQHHRKP